MRIILFISFLICSILCISIEFIYPQEAILQLTLSICTSLSGVLLFIFASINENTLSKKVKEYYQYSFVKDDTIKKLKNEVTQKDEVIINFQDQLEVKNKEYETLKSSPKESEELDTLKNKIVLLTTETQYKTTEIEHKESEINKLKLEVKNWCDKVEDLNKTISKPSEDAVLIDDNHKEEETDDSEKTKQECLAFLEMIKWSNHNFNCSKCDNTSYNTLENLNSRKCTKCNHIESAMAHTLYMGVRFPLDKAFDMTKAVMNNPKISIEQLMEETGLTKNTCWKFKNKIIDQRTAFKKKFKRDPEHWEELIYFK